MRTIKFDNLQAHFILRHGRSLYDLHAPLDYDRYGVYDRWLASKGMDRVNTTPENQEQFRLYANDPDGMAKELPQFDFERWLLSTVPDPYDPKVWRKYRGVLFQNFEITRDTVPSFTPWSEERRDAEMARYFPNGPNSHDMGGWLQIREAVRRHEEDPRDAAKVIGMILRDFGPVFVRIERED